MPKCAYLVKRFRNCYRPMLDAGNRGKNLENSVSVANGCLSVHRLPKLPMDVGCDVCGFGKPAKFLLTHPIHPDHCPAITGVQLVCAPPLIEQIEKFAPYYYREEFNVEVVEFKGEYFETHHYPYDPRLQRYVKVKACGYILKDVKCFFIPESFEANRLLAEARAKGLTPLYTWQPRDHLNDGPTLHAKDIYDGYFVDPRPDDKRDHASNVIPKCVPSILDIKTDPDRWPGNKFAEYFRTH